MPSGWEVYYVVFLSATLALAIPLILWGLSHLFRSGKKESNEQKKIHFSQEEGIDPPLFIPPPAVLGRRMNVRFFMAANAALLLITLGLVLIPCVGALAASPETGYVGIFVIISIASSAALGLLYSARKGNLAWLGTYQKRDLP